jgi:hypothetical protein
VPWHRRLVAGFPPRQSGFDPRSSHVGFVVDKVALGQVFSECFCFPCQLSFHRLLQTNHLSYGAGTIGQLVTDVRRWLSLTPPDETKNLALYATVPLCLCFRRFSKMSLGPVLSPACKYVRSIDEITDLHSCEGVGYGLNSFWTSPKSVWLLISSRFSLGIILQRMR